MTELTAPAIILPRKPVAATQKSPRLLILYGPPKVGKTTLLSQLDNNLIIDLEEGSTMLEALKVTANSLSDLTVIGKQIITEKHPYKYVSIDTIDKIEEWAEIAATELYRQTAIGKSFVGNSIFSCVPFAIEPPRTAIVEGFIDKAEYPEYLLLPYLNLKEPDLEGWPKTGLPATKSCIYVGEVSIFPDSLFLCNSTYSSKKSQLDNLKPSFLSFFTILRIFGAF